MNNLYIEYISIDIVLFIVNLLLNLVRHKEGNVE